MVEERNGTEFFEYGYADVDITNDLMFSVVMNDSEICIELLEYLLPGRKIQRVQYISFDDDGEESVRQEADGRSVRPETQKTLLGYFGMRGVRLDAYLDDGKTIYSIEMQTARDAAIAQRCRLYQSHIDISQLRRGVDYDQLRPCFVIFICKYDPFGKGLYRYTFRNKCDELEGLALNDGAYKLFFNTAGHIGEISPRLKELLEYMNDTRAYPVNESDNALIHKIDQAVSETKTSKEWRDTYMMLQMKLREEAIRSEERGRAKGKAEGKNEKAIEDAKNLLREGLSAELIARAINIPLSEVNELKAQMAQ